MSRNIAAQNYIALASEKFNSAAEKYAQKLNYASVFFTPGSVEALLFAEKNLLDQLHATEEKLVSLLNDVTLQQHLVRKMNQFNYDIDHALERPDIVGTSSAPSFTNDQGPRKFVAQSMTKGKTIAFSTRYLDETGHRRKRGRPKKKPDMQLTKKGGDIR